MVIIRTIIVLITFIFTSLLYGQKAQDINSIFQKANNLVLQQRYEEAIKLYESLMKLKIEDPDLYYNVGTLYAKWGMYGRAIQYYKKALRLDPGDEDAKTNLEIVKEMLAHRLTKEFSSGYITRESPWENLVERFTPNEITILFLVTYTLFWLLVILKIKLKKEWLSSILSLVLSVMIIVTLSIATIFVSRVLLEQNERGVVVKFNAVDVKEGPIEESKTLFKLYEGSEVEIKTKFDNWYKIKDPKGRVGWVKSNDIGLI